jgi:hypothetical protein
MKGVAVEAVRELWVNLARCAVVCEVQGAVWRVEMVLWWPWSMALAAMTWLCSGMHTSLAVTWPVVVLAGGWEQWGWGAL